MRRARHVRLGLLLAGFVGISAALAHGCNVYDESLLEPLPGSDVEAKNGVGWWSKNDERGCYTAGMPRSEDRPAGAAGEDVGPIYLAIASMRLGSLNERGDPDPNAWKEIGFDLDGVCTASDTCESEVVAPSCRAAASALPRDGLYCRDNTFGRLEHAASLIPDIAKRYGLSDDAFNCALCAGHYNFLIRITGYNGQKDDDRIRIDLYPAPGLEKPYPWDCSSPDWKKHGVCFQADDPWLVQDDAVVEPRGGPDLPLSKLFDDEAYVRDGYVVMRLPENTLFWFPGYKAVVIAYPLRVQNGIVTGKLARGADGVWRVTDGVIGGRAKEADLIAGLRLMGFCESNDPANFERVTTFVRSNLDVLADGRTDPNAPCDAMSLGLAFTAHQARAGRLERVEPLVECAPPRDAGADVGAAGR